MYRKPVFFFKIINKLSPTYFAAYLSNNTLPSVYNTKISNQNTVRTAFCRTKDFKKTFYPCYNIALVSGVNQMQK